MCSRLVICTLCLLSLAGPLLALSGCRRGGRVPDAVAMRGKLKGVCTTHFVQPPFHLALRGGISVKRQRDLEEAHGFEEGMKKGEIEEIKEEDDALYTGQEMLDEILPEEKPEWWVDPEPGPCSIKGWKMQRNNVTGEYSMVPDDGARSEPANTIKLAAEHQPGGEVQDADVLRMSGGGGGGGSHVPPLNGWPGGHEGPSWRAFGGAARSIFYRWTALSLAVEQGWGGKNGHSKRARFLAATVDLFRGGRAHADEVMAMLEEGMTQLFKTEAQDGSCAEVACVLCRHAALCFAGNLEESIALAQKGGEAGGVKQSKAEGGGEVSASEDEDEDEDRGDSVMAESVLDSGCFWDDMPSEERESWQVLGWGKDAWNGDAAEPASHGMLWGELDEAEQRAAMSLGFTWRAWDALRDKRA